MFAPLLVPGPEETNLPACWQMTGGQGINRLCRQVDRRQLGTTTITATAGCSSNTVVIIVQDTNPPAIYCGDVYFCNDNGECSAQMDLEDYIYAWDDCGAVTLTFSPDEGTFDVGEHSVTATATDVAGNTATCSFTVTVWDCENPHITCPGTVTTTNDPGKCYATGVALDTPITSDNCGVASVVNNAPSQFPVGTTMVTWTVTDTAGNIATCNQTVQVNDVEKPAIACSPNIVVCTSSGGGSVVTWPAPTATDNCEGATVTCDPSSGSSFSLGTTTVTCTAIDSSGNSNNCSFAVSVIRVTLQNVTFSGTNYHAVLRDTNGVAYPTPHWTTNYSAPVCYTRNTHMQVAAIFGVEPSTWSGPVVVYGDSSGPKLRATTNTASGGTLTVSLTSTNAFVNQVDYLNPMSIDWSYSPDYGTNWCTAGTSTNRAYVTLSNPIALVYHTVVHIDCVNAAGQTTTNGTADAIFQEFTDRVVRRVYDSAQMTYWASSQMGGTETGEILQRTDANGNCQAWSGMLRDCFRVQGINADRIRALPVSASDNSILVKSWSFNEPPSGTGTYPYVVGTDAFDQNGIPGQGNANPPGAFNGHWITRCNDAYYDPSYGTAKVTGTNKDKTYEDGALDGYGASLPPSNGTSVRKNNVSSGSASELDYQVDN